VSFPLHGLYAVTPDNPSCAALAAVLEGGCRLIQYRDKNIDAPTRNQRARAFLTLCRQHNAKLLINDDWRLAAEIGADGAHLGRGDGTLREARSALGDAAILGATCYQSLELARRAEDDGASYAAFGAAWPSPTKPEAPLATLALYEAAARTLSIPVCAIGGITLANVRPLLESGVSLIALVSDLFSAPDIAAQTRAHIRFFEEFRHAAPQQPSPF
jgi:thiamine-phosphate pyrophosphorylase